MTIYIILGIGLLYLSSHIINFKKVPSYKRKYLVAIDSILVVGLIMGVLGILFPSEASGRFAMITSILLIVMSISILAFIIFLFLINALGSLIALIGVLNRARWWGWVLGIIMAGGAAVIKLAMDTIPSFAAFLLGVHAGSGGANHPHPHVLTTTVIPTFTNLKALGTFAIVIELVFAVWAIFALKTKRQAVAR
ncbi:MAG: hypothetical protein ACYCYO_19070 [Bacilli bacterium]